MTLNGTAEHGHVSLEWTGIGFGAAEMIGVLPVPSLLGVD